MVGPEADEPEVRVPIDRHDDDVGVLADLTAEPVDPQWFARRHERAHPNARRDRLDTAYPHHDHAAIVVGGRGDRVNVR